MELALANPVYKFADDERRIIEQSVGWRLGFPGAEVPSLEKKGCPCKEWVDRGHINPITSDVERQGIAKSSEAKLGRAVRYEAGHPYQPRYRYDIDDMPAPPSHHRRQKCRRQPHRGEQVHLHELFPLGPWHL